MLQSLSAYHTPISAILGTATETGLTIWDQGQGATSPAGTCQLGSQTKWLGVGRSYNHVERRVRDAQLLEVLMVISNQQLIQQSANTPFIAGEVYRMMARTSSREMSCFRSISDPPRRCLASSEICWIASMMGSTIWGSASRLAETPATNDLVSRGTSVLVRSSRIELNPFNPSKPPFRPPSERVKATAPPLTETALSIPLGFPCSTFSARNA